MADIRDSLSFQLKKWILFSFCALNIIGTIIMATLAAKLVSDYIDDQKEVKREDAEAVKTLSLSLIYVASGLTILFNLLGLIGSFKEHYCMTMSYAILTAIGTLFTIGTAVKNPFYFINVFIDVLVFALAVAFALDLRRRRRLLFATPIVMTAASPPPVVVQVVPYMEKDGQQYTAVAQEDSAAKV